MRIARIPSYARPDGRRSGRGGFTLLEMMLAAAVLAIAISGSAGAMLSSIKLDRVNRERALAVQAARRVLEQAQDLELEDVYPAYNQRNDDDPPALVAAGTLPGPNFASIGLQVQSGDADGMTGEVLFPTVDVGGGVIQLREDVVDPALGMPADLNMDGVIDAADHSGDYHMLPMRVRVSWTGITGNRSVDLVTVLSHR